MEDKKLPPGSVTIHNKISHSFRSIHVDGAFGGITPQGIINVSFFCERGPIPKSSEYEVLEGGKLGKLIQNAPESKTGILREFEMGVYMSVPVAKALIALLSTKIFDLENRKNNDNK